MVESGQIRESGIFSPSQLLLLDYLHSGKISPSNQPASADHDTLLRLIQTHRVIGNVARNSGQENDLVLKERIDHLHYLNKLQQLQFTAELIRVDLHFKENGIELMPLKGVILSQLIYGDPTERQSRDIDILIRVKDLDKAAAILTSMGYQMNYLFETPKQKRAIIRHYHHLEFYNPQQNITLELHWKLTSSRNFEFDTDELWSSSTLIEIGGTSFRLMSRENLLQFLCVHGTLHSYFRLQWLCDINQLLMNMDASERTILLNKMLGSESFIFVRTTLELIRILLRNEFMPEAKVDRLNPKVDKLVRIALEEIRINTGSDLYPGKQKDRFRRMVHLHRVQFLTGGLKALLLSLFGRNVRPENWRIFVFPDSVFFLNHVFSRFIWLYRKFTKNN